MAKIINEMPEELEDLEEGSMDIDLDQKQENIVAKEPEPEPKQEDLDF